MRVRECLGSCYSNRAPPHHRWYWKPSLSLPLWAPGLRCLGRLMRPAAPAWLPIARALPIGGASELWGSGWERNPTWGPVAAGEGQRGPSSYCRPSWTKAKGALSGPSCAPIQLPMHRGCLALSGLCRMLEGHNSSHLGTSWGQFSLSEPGSAFPSGLGVGGGSGGLPLTSPVLSPMSSQGCFWPGQLRPEPHLASCPQGL